MNKDLNIDVVNIERIKDINFDPTDNKVRNYGPHQLAVGIMITYSDYSPVCIITKIGNNVGEGWQVIGKLAGKIMDGGVISQRAVVRHLVSQQPFLIKSRYDEVKDIIGEAIIFADNILINGTPINKQVFISIVADSMCNDEE